MSAALHPNHISRCRLGLVAQCPSPMRRITHIIIVLVPTPPPLLRNHPWSDAWLFLTGRLVFGNRVAPTKKMVMPRIWTISGPLPLCNTGFLSPQRMCPTAALSQDHHWAQIVLKISLLLLDNPVKTFVPPIQVKQRTTGRANTTRCIPVLEGVRGTLSNR
jgi:hypothetical protein